MADIVATIDKAAVAGKSRVMITDELVDEVLAKYKKTVQEMIDTCPDTPEYADRKAEYLAKMDIVKEYAPKVIDDVDEIEKMINYICACNSMVACSGIKGPLMKLVMPILKREHCDMKVAKIALDRAMAKGDVVLEAQLNGTGDN